MAKPLKIQVKNSILRSFGTIIMIFSIILLVFVLNTHSTEYEEQGSFFRQREKHLIEEYRLCTEDSITTDIDSLLKWKSIIDIRCEMPEYKKILKDFIQNTGVIKDVYPCQILNWHLDRMKYIRNREDSLKNILLKKSDYIVDSFRIQLELQKNPASDFDFSSIPFGLSQKVFTHLFTREYSYPLIDTKRHLFVEHFPIQDMSFMIRFHFTIRKIFFKYEIEGYSFSGDSLNSVVRIQAALLKDRLAEKIGPPDRLYRIGYFDIKSGEITPYAKWENDDYSIIIGIGIEGNRYFARQTVILKKLVNTRFGRRE